MDRARASRNGQHNVCALRYMHHKACYALSAQVAEEIQRSFQIQINQLNKIFKGADLTAPFLFFCNYLTDKIHINRVLRAVRRQPYGRVKNITKRLYTAIFRQ